MQVSQACIDLVKQFEGCRLDAYADVVGVWTIGFGHTGGVCEGRSCTQEQADAWLADDLQRASQGVLALVRVPLTQGQLDAMTSFAFNLGVGALAKSTLLKDVNMGIFDVAANEFPKWSNAGGKVVPGLLRRRLAEQALFKS